MQQIYKVLLIVAASVLLPVLAFGAEPSGYSVSNIPTQLQENADAVVRFHETSINIISPGKVECREKKVITILKESGYDKSLFHEFYSVKHSKITSISATVYDSKGEKAKKIKTDEIVDVSATDNGTVFDDSRVKIIDPRYQTYPFTVEYEWVYTQNTALWLPVFTPFYGYNTAVEKIQLLIKTGKDYQLNYKAYNQAPDCEKTIVENDYLLHKWSFANVTAFQEEHFAPNPIDFAPIIKVSPSLFEFDGYSGNLNTWQALGNFESTLLKDRDVLPESTVAKIKELVKDCTSDKEKVERIYRYSQEKNRYVSIQVGIGGMQPMPAAEVDKQSYGDCKALSNYVMALLKCVGIQSHTTLIESNENPTSIDPQFPNIKFNHMVLCVPMAIDTIWLECTNSHLPAGYFGDWVHNRYALLVDGENSHLVRTNTMQGNTNCVTQTGTVKLLPTGEATAMIESQFAGINYSDQLKFLLLDDQTVKQALIKATPIAKFDLVSYKINESRKGNPFIKISKQLNLPGFMTKSGTRLMMPINQCNAQRYIPPYARKRVFPVQVVNDQLECDTMVYQIPANYKVEALPSPVNIETAYGSYQSKSEFANGQITYTRSFFLKKGKYIPESYNDFRSFFEKVALADNAKCIFTPQ